MVSNSKFNLGFKIISLLLYNYYTSKTKNPYIRCFDIKVKRKLIYTIRFVGPYK